jgi:hypothetical protein
MAKFFLVIEDKPDGSVDVQCHQMVPIGEDPAVPTRAGKLVRYAQLKMAEMEFAAEQDRKTADGQRGEEAARCWH